MIVSDSLGRRGECEKEVGGYLQSEKLQNKETVVEGLDLAEDAFIGRIKGNNIGKMVVKLDYSAVCKMCLFLSSSFEKTVTDR